MRTCLYAVFGFIIAFAVTTARPAAAMYHADAGDGGAADVEWQEDADDEDASCAGESWDGRVTHVAGEWLEVEDGEWGSTFHYDLTTVLQNKHGRPATMGEIKRGDRLTLWTDCSGHHATKIIDHNLVHRRVSGTIERINRYHRTIVIRRDARRARVEVSAMPLTRFSGATFGQLRRGQRIDAAGTYNTNTRVFVASEIRRRNAARSGCTYVRTHDGRTACSTPGRY